MPLCDISVERDGGLAIVQVSSSPASTTTVSTLDHDNEDDHVTDKQQIEQATFIKSSSVGGEKDFFALGYLCDDVHAMAFNRAIIAPAAEGRQEFGDVESIPESDVFYDAQSWATSTSASASPSVTAPVSVSESIADGDDLSFASAQSRSFTPSSSSSGYFSVPDADIDLDGRVGGGARSRCSSSDGGIATSPYKKSSLSSSSSSDGARVYHTADDGEDGDEGEEMDAVSLASNVVAADRIYFRGDVYIQDDDFTPRRSRERRASNVTITMANKE